MVTYKKCYCPRINDYISAEEANHWFIGKDTLGNIIQKKLFSNNEFQCAEDCQLNLTCINIGVDFSNPENSNKIKPYFSNRTGGTHSDSCSRVKKLVAKLSKSHIQTKYYSIHDNLIKLDFSIEEGFLEEKKATKSTSSVTNKLVNSSSKTISSPTNKENLKNKTRLQHISSITRLIDLYEEYKINGLNGINFVNKYNVPINFDDVFYNLDSHTTIDDKKFIYWGLAKCFQKNSDQLVLMFTHRCTYDGITSFLSTILFKDQFIKNRKKTLYTKLEKLANNKQEFLLYYFGNFTQNKNTYINFDYVNNNIPQSITIKNSNY